ncbi:MAG: glycerol kinase GlpK [Gemmatimonadales bacterium]
MPSILALDQGTTGSTALVIAADGRVLSRAYREFTQHFPAPGMVEHDAEEIWRVTLEVAREALDESGETPAGIGITNQRETVVAWDRASGAPLHRALVWQDRRTTQRCRDLRAELGDAYIADRTGLVWDPYFSATKIEWLLEHVPDLRARAEAGEAVFGTIDAWLVHRLTSGAAFVTDHTNACRTLLYNLERRAWDPELLDLFGVPQASLPEIRPSSGIVGAADPEHLGAEIPIAGIAGDQQAALFGQGCWQPGQAKCTYGTGAFLLMSVGGKLPRLGEGTGVLATVACDEAGQPSYALEGSIFVAGAAVQWLRDGLGIIGSAAETEALAAGIDDTGGVYFVPAFVGLGAPHWEAEARGTIVGLTRGTGRAQLVRAALEAMAYGTREVAEAMTAVSGVAPRELKADGGAAANDWLMQFQADVLGARVARPDVVETTAVGAAGLAGLATGVWPEAERFLESRSYSWFEPGSRREEGYAGWRRAVDAVLHWARNPMR